jgi:hypothetical protein
MNTTHTASSGTDLDQLKPNAPVVYAPVQAAAYRHGYRKAISDVKVALEAWRAPVPAAPQQDALDAARYRWLRDQDIMKQFGTLTPYIVQGQTMRVLEGKEADAAIDAARAAKGETQ